MSHKLAKAFIIIVGMTACGFAFAHSGASGIVKTRMDMMSDIANQMKTIAGMVKGETEFDGEQAALSALAISDHAKHLKKAFPEGSIKGPSEALPAIWEEWETFSRLLDTMESSSNELAERARNATVETDIASSFQTLGKTCATCHQDFRKKK